MYRYEHDSVHMLDIEAKAHKLNDNAPGLAQIEALLWRVSEQKNLLGRRK